MRQDFPMPSHLRPGTSRLPLWLHVLAVLAVAVIALFGIWVLFTSEATTPFAETPTDPLLLEIIRLVFYTMAGIGGVVALTIAYRKQRLGEAAEAREEAKLFTEQFAAAAEQLSSEHAANRMAGVYAMASLADDWAHERQKCINVLCAYLRMPYDPPRLPKKLTAEEIKEHRHICQEQQVRHAILDVMADRLRTEPVDGRTWHWCDFDFSSATLDGGNFASSVFLGQVSFNGASFPEGHIYLGGVKFHGSVAFYEARFNGAFVDFSGIEFKGRNASFARSEFTDGTVIFHGALFDSKSCNFMGAEFSGGRVEFGVPGGNVPTRFRGGGIIFTSAWFDGAEVDFRGAEFGPAIVDFREVADWSLPPTFDNFPDGPPNGLLLPEQRRK